MISEAWGGGLERLALKEEGVSYQGVGARLKKYERESRRRPPERGFRQVPGLLAPSECARPRVAPGPLHPRWAATLPALLCPPAPAASASGHTGSLPECRFRPHSRPPVPAPGPASAPAPGPPWLGRSKPPPCARSAAQRRRRSPPVLAQCPDAQLEAELPPPPPRAPTLVLGIGRRGHAAGPGVEPVCPAGAASPGRRRSGGSTHKAEPSPRPAKAPPFPAPCPTAWSPAPPRAPPHPRRPRPLHLGPRPPVHSPAPPEAPPAWVPARLLLGRAALGCPGTSLSPETRARGFPYPPEARSVGASPNARWAALTGSAQLWKPLVLPALLPCLTPSSTSGNLTWSPGSRLGVKTAWSRSRGSPRSPGLHREDLRSGHREASVPPRLRNTCLY